MAHNQAEEEIIKHIENEQYDAALNGIVESYSDILYAHVIRMVKNDANAKDVLQNTMLKTWKGLKGFRKEAKLSTWLYRIAANEAITFLNKQQRNTTTELSIEHTQTSSDGKDPDEIERLLQAAIDLLPVKQKQVFVMRYYEELKYQEISKIVGTSEGALKASYHHAVKKIEEFLRSN